MRKKMAVKRKTGLKPTGTIKKKNQQLKGRQIDGRDWAGLADYLLELVIERLPLVDCLSFSSVCKPWECVITKLFEGSSRGIPLLLKSNQGMKETRTCLNVLDKKKNSSFDIRMPKLIRGHIWGSFHDWLVLGTIIFKFDLHIRMFNPFSGENIKLPFTYNDYHMIVLSSVPSNPRCIYMLVRKKRGVDFWTSGAPRKWRKCDFMGSEGVVDALYHEGNFYLLKSSYEMVIIDEVSVVSMLNNTGESSITTQYLPLKVSPCLEISPGNVKKYIVESSGDILLVCREFYCEETCGFKAYMLDISQMVWVKWDNNNNDKMVIMLGMSCCRSFNAKMELGDDALARNIYFSNNSYAVGVNEWEKHSLGCDDDEIDDWCVFSLGRKTSCNDWPRRGKLCGGTWVTAPIWWCLGQQQQHQETQRPQKAQRLSKDRVRRTPQRSTRFNDYVT